MQLKITLENNTPPETRDITKLSKDVLVGKNRIIRRLGEGYTGIVYRAFDEENKREVAVKFLKKTEKNYDILIKRFKDEYLNQLAGKTHDNIAQVYQLGYFNGFFYFTSEYINGRDIYVATRRPSYEDKIKFFIQLLEGLDFIHRNGILHLDIKTENVLCCLPPQLAKKSELTPSDMEEAYSSTDWLVKLVDFGLASTREEGISVGGTPHYIAPEVALGWKDKIDARADLFSAAVLMYYCLTSTFPFVKRWGAKDLKTAAEIIANEPPPEAPTRFIEEIPEYLSTIIMRLLAKDPEDRFYPNARAVINALIANRSDGFGSFERGAWDIKKAYFHPTAGKHIGRKKEQALINIALEEFIAGNQPEKSIFGIHGSTGAGKSHLLQNIRKQAELHPDKIQIACFQASHDEVLFENWLNNLRQKLDENKLPTLILIDDLHELNNNRRAVDVITGLINQTIERLEHKDLFKGIMPILICHTYDSIAGDDIYSRDKISRIDLKNFDKTDIIEYLSATPALKTFKDSKKVKDLADRLHSKTAGLPSLVALLLEELESRSLLFNLEGELLVENVDLVSKKEPSTSIKDYILSKYASTNPSERNILNLMAVWNFKNLSRPITRLDINNFFYSASLNQNINNLIDKGIIQYSLGGVLDRALVFLNDYFGRVVYENMPLEERELIHDSLAGYVKTDKDVVDLHIGYGTDKVRATAKLIELGSQKLFREGNAAFSIELFEEAMKYSNDEQKSNLPVLLLEACYYADKYERAEEIYNDAVKSKASDKIALAIKLIPSLIEQRKYVEADGLIGDAIILCNARQITPNLLTLKNSKATILYKKSQLEQEKSGELLREAGIIYEKTEQEERNLNELDRIRIRNNEMGVVLIHLGEFSAAIPKLTEKLKRAESFMNVYDVFLATLWLAEANRLSGFHAEATKFAEKAFLLAQKSNSGNWLMKAHDIMANLYHDMGRFGQAVEESNKCIVLGACADEKGYDAYVYSFLKIGHCYKEKEEWVKAKMYFEFIISRFTHPLFSMSAHEGLGEVYCKIGDYKKAEISLEEAERLLANVPIGIAKPHIDNIKGLRTDIAEKNHATNS